MCVCPRACAIARLCQASSFSSFSDHVVRDARCRGRLGDASMNGRALDDGDLDLLRRSCGWHASIGGRRDEVWPCRRHSRHREGARTVGLANRLKREVAPRICHGLGGFATAECNAAAIRRPTMKLPLMCTDRKGLSNVGSWIGALHWDQQQSSSCCDCGRTRTFQPLQHLVHLYQQQQLPSASSSFHDSLAADARRGRGEIHLTG